MITVLFKKLHDSIQSQRDRWILWIPVPLGLGIVFYFVLKSEPPLLAGALVMGALVPFGKALYSNRPAFYTWLIFFLLALGFTTAQFRTERVTAPVLADKTYPLILEGRVTEVDALPGQYRVIMDNLAIKEGRIRQKELPQSVRVRLKGNDTTEPVAGDIIQVKTILQPLSAPLLPGAFDFQRHAFFKGLGSTGYAIGDVRIVKEHEGGFFFEKLRHGIRHRLEARIEDKDAAAVTTALLVGDSSGISKELWEKIRLSGIAHLIAISGSHITLIAAFVFFSIRAILAAFPYIALRWPIKKVSAFLSIFGMTFYMLLIGSPVSAVRAVISTGVVMGAIMLDRDPFTLRLAAFAAFIIMLFEPENVVGPSFQLSFAAVIAMVAFYEATQNWWIRQNEEKSWLKTCGLYLLGCFATTVIATLATAPFALFHFGRVPFLSGLVANLIAVPVSAFVTIPFGFLSCLLMPLGLEAWPLWLTEESVRLITATARTTAAWHYAVFYTDTWPAWILGLMTAGGLWLCLWQERMRYLGLAPIVCAMGLIFLTPRPDILAGEEGKLFAVRDDAGKLWISSNRVEKFTRDEWIKLEGGAGYGFWPQSGATPNGVLSCDVMACLYKAKGYTVSFIKLPQAAETDCDVADLVISAEKISRQLCAGKSTIIDSTDFWRNGAHAVYLDDAGGLRITSVRGLRGDRPWTR